MSNTNNMTGGLALPPANAAAPAQPTQAQFLDEMLLEDPDMMDFDGSFLPNQDFSTDFSTPTQQQMPMFPPPPTSTPVSAFPQPDTTLGPSWDPRIGWYYPAPAPMSMQPPQIPAVMPFALPQAGFTPVSTTPATSAMPSRTPTPVPAVMPQVARPRPDRKRKYGPAAYLDEQAKAKTTDDRPRTVSVSEANYTSASKRRDDKSSAGLTTTRGGRKKRPSLVQRCICGDKDTPKIPRPMNAFMLYRKAHETQVRKQMGPVCKNPEVSQRVGEMWRNESEDVKDRFRLLQQKAEQKHKELYPKYQYQPKRKAASGFGSASCTCGAFEANMAKTVAHGGNILPEGDLDDLFADDTDADGEYAAPRGYVAAKQYAPRAPQMTIPDPSTFGFAPAQQAQAEAYVNDMKRKRNAAAEPDPSESPVSRRLRSALTGAGISYAEPNDDDIEDDVFDTTTRSKRRPTAITTSPRINTADLLKTPSPQAPALDLGDSPSRNTRSKSKGSIDYTAYNFDFGLGSDFTFDPALGFDQLLNSDPFQADDDDEIVVAKPPSPRKTRSQNSTSTNKSRRSSRESLGTKVSQTRSYNLRRSRPSSHGSSGR